MKVGIISSGKAYNPVVRKLISAGIEVLELCPEGLRINGDLVMEGKSVQLLRHFLQQLDDSRIIWAFTDRHENGGFQLSHVLRDLNPEDFFIDSYSIDETDSAKLAENLAAIGVNTLDVGVISNGHLSLTVGGSRKAFEQMEYVLDSACDAGRYMFCGPSGSGIFTKRLYGEIKHGIISAYANASEKISVSKYKEDLNFEEFFLFVHTFVGGSRCTDIHWIQSAG